MAPVDRDIPVTWDDFRGQLNTDALLRVKADVVSRMIEMAFDTGLEIAEEMKKNDPKISAMDRATTIMAETAAVLLQVTDRIVSGCLPAHGRDVFMDALERAVGEKLQTRGYSRDAFMELLPPRYAEYAHYKQLVVDIDHPQRAVFWEFAKKIAFEMGIGKSAIFNVMMSNLLVKQVHRWNLVQLLKG